MNTRESPTTIRQAIVEYLAVKASTHSTNTARTYRNALNLFVELLEQQGLSSDRPPTSLPEEAVGWFAATLKDYSPATEQLYMTALVDFYGYLVAERLTDINLPRLRELARRRARRPGLRLPQFNSENIDKIIEYAENISKGVYGGEQERLRALRDSAFLLTLADTGLRVHEACALRRGDLDWNNGKALITGKGNRQAVVRFSKRALRALQAYLSARATLDGASGRQLSSLPLFARHDRGAGRKIKPMTTATGRNIVNQRVREVLGKEAVGSITPHSFRHYFVTVVLRASNNLKLAQELARHKNIAVTQRYAHMEDGELDQKYADIFD